MVCSSTDAGETSPGKTWVVSAAASPSRRVSRSQLLCVVPGHFWTVSFSNLRCVASDRFHQQGRGPSQEAEEMMDQCGGRAPLPCCLPMRKDLCGQWVECLQCGGLQTPCRSEVETVQQPLEGSSDWADCQSGWRALVEARWFRPRCSFSHSTTSTHELWRRRVEQEDGRGQGC